MEEEFNQNENPEDEEILQYEKREYFKEIVDRVKQAQLQIKSVKEEIEKEKLLRGESARILEEKRQQIKQLLVKSNQTTTEKVEELIRDTLENLVQQTLLKQQELRDLQNNERERCYLNFELEKQFRGLRHYISLTRKELQESDEHAQRLKIQIQRQTNTNLLMKTDIDEKSQKIQQLRQEAQQLRAAIQNLDDVKKVINRVTDQDQVIIANDGPKKKSKPQNKSASQQRVNYNVHDVDDNFWYGDKQIKLPSVQSQRKKN